MGKVFVDTPCASWAEPRAGEPRRRREERDRRHRGGRGRGRPERETLTAGPSPIRARWPPPMPNRVAAADEGREMLGTRGRSGIGRGCLCARRRMTHLTATAGCRPPPERRRVAQGPASPWLRHGGSGAPVRERAAAGTGEDLCRASNGRRASSNSAATAASPTRLDSREDDATPADPLLLREFARQWRARAS
ncbi:unnamed protein product [Urochloa humidicola]